MYFHEATYRVPYFDVDQMGIVYHGNYAKYYEFGRTEMFRELCYSYKDMEKEGTAMVVVDLQSQFIRSARYDEVLTIRTELRQLPGWKMTFHSEIYNETNDLLNLGVVNFIFVSLPSLKKRRAPEALLKAISAHFKKTE